MVLESSSARTITVVLRCERLPLISVALSMTMLAFTSPVLNCNAGMAVVPSFNFNRYCSLLGENSGRVSPLVQVQ